MSIYKRRCFACAGSGLDVWRASDCPACAGSGEIDDPSVTDEPRPTTAELVRVRKLLTFDTTSLYAVGSVGGPCYIRVNADGISCSKHGQVLCEGRTRLSASGLLREDPNAPAKTEETITPNEAA